jgi:hypothetical protein
MREALFPRQRLVRSFHRPTDEVSMMSPPRRLALLLVIALLPAVRVAAEKAHRSATPATLFDPARHMRVSEVRPGMKGYGLSVFSGTRIEPFQVEVVSVLHNFNPKYDVVLIRCHGANLELTGAVAGMSGSPVFLKDDRGRDRMIGAFAYGWPMTKEPLAGVQPIEYMLALPGTTKPTAGPAPAEAGATPGNADRVEAGARLAWSIPSATGWPHARLPRPAGAQPLVAQPGNPRLAPLATPLMVGGVPQSVLDSFSPLFQSAGLVPLQAGGGGSAKPTDEPGTISPGSVLAVPLLVGDADMTAVGTCTEVLGDRVFGFGHPFQNEGSVLLPMGAGKINGIIPNMTTSFKLGTLTSTLGRLTADQTVGVSGRLGDPPPLVPIDVRIVYTDGSEDRPYHFDAALHPRFTPLLAAVALASSVGGAHDLPQYNTCDYDLTLEFKNGRTLHIDNTSVNVNPMALFTEVGMPMMTASENPFERVALKKVSGTIRVTPEAREAQILEVNVPRSKYRPGETVRAFVTYKPFRAPEAILPVELELPKDLPEAQYQLVFSDWTRYATDEQQSKPFRFTAEKVEEVFDVLKDIASIRHNALYVRLVRQPDGVAIGRTAMPQLPSSRRQILMGAGRSNTTKFVSSTVKTMPTRYVMQGAADFAITVDRDLKVETGKAPAAAPNAPAPNVPAGAPAAQPAGARGTGAATEPIN